MVGKTKVKGTSIILVKPATQQQIDLKKTLRPHWPLCLARSTMLILIPWTTLAFELVVQRDS